MSDHWSKEKILHRTVYMILWALGLFISVSVIELFLPNLIPFKLFDMWRAGDGDVFGALDHIKLLFLLPFALTCLGFFATMHYKKPLPEFDLTDVFHISLRAGILEEIIFRWLAFYSAIVGILIGDFLFFRALFGFSITEILYTGVLMPLADAATLHRMTEIIYPGSHWIMNLPNHSVLEFMTASNMPWVVGAALISANGRFRDGHSYQGCLGWVHSWYIGMLLFYVTFEHGLASAIVIHVLYDVVVLGTIYLLRATLARNYVPDARPLFADLF